MLEVYTLPESENEFFRVRKEKLQRIRGKGINPYPTKFHRTHTSKQAVDEFIKSETSETLIDNQISVAGRIMGRRGMGKASFIDLRDIDGNIQIMMRANQLNERYEDLEDLDIEMNENVKKLKINNLKTHEKIIEIIMIRLEKNFKNKKLLKRTYFTLSSPSNLNILISSTYNTVNNVWYLANDKSYDFNFYTKRLILFYIYISTLLFWLNDRENNIDKARFFLSKQIKKTGSLKKIKDFSLEFLTKFKKYSY